MSTTTIQKWGNSYAVRIPKTAMHDLKLRAGNSVEIREAARGTLSIIPVRRPDASLSEMVSGITENNQHKLIEWGAAVGNEAW
jgi:antitoxin MazE